MSPLSDLVARYLRIRETGMKLISMLVGKLPKDVLEQGARELGFQRNGILVFSSMHESSILMDYCLYNIRRHGRNTIENFLANSPPAEGSEQWPFLQAMSRSWYSLFSVQEVMRDVGARVLDILRDSEHLLLDVGFGRSAVPGALIASRVLPFDEFIITSGAALPLGGGPARRERLTAQLTKVVFANNIESLQSLTLEQEKELARTIISTALSWGASSEIRYQDPNQADDDLKDQVPEQRRRIPVPAGGRVGRNDPCRCGSGKKFKKCCGR